MENALQEILKDDLSMFAIPLYLAAVAIEAIWSRGIEWSNPPACPSVTRQ